MCRLLVVLSELYRFYPGQTLTLGVIAWFSWKKRQKRPKNRDKHFSEIFWPKRWITARDNIFLIFPKNGDFSTWKPHKIPQMAIKREIWISSILHTINWLKNIKIKEIRGIQKNISTNLKRSLEFVVKFFFWKNN